MSVEPPSRTFFPELHDRFREPDAWQIFDDVLPTLHELAALGINLGIISNWDDRLVPMLKSLGLNKYFEAMIVSCDVGFSKLSPVIFEQAAKKLGVPPGSILHVGDSLDADVAGAKAAGFASVLIDRTLREDVPGRIKSLRRLEGMF
ncbi:MAG: HAD-superfamily hydrolase [Pedosphaera sp.]|nr:HAD-superfamily hydrolase [Pedosphaera sp.]